MCILEDKCQFWLDKSAKVLTSPYVDGQPDVYYNNMNCTWILEAEEGFYINFETERFLVRQNNAYWYTKYFS